MTDRTTSAASKTGRPDALADLKAANGWLNIIGRCWLEPGSVTVGSRRGQRHRALGGPDPCRHARRRMQTAASPSSPADGSEALRLKLDKKNPPRFPVGQLLLEVTTLNGENALRVRDTAVDRAGRIPGHRLLSHRSELAHRRRLDRRWRSRSR